MSAQSVLPKAIDPHTEAFELVWYLGAMLKLTANANANIAMDNDDVHALLMPIEIKAKRLLEALS